MKVIIISDIHGNYDALRVLPEEYDELWVLGDLVNYGPQPKEVIDEVKLKAAVIVRGNHDHVIGYDEVPRWKQRYYAMAETTRKYTASVVSSEQKQFLRSLPLKAELERDGTTFCLTHAKPSGPLHGWCPQESEEWVREVESVSTDRHAHWFEFGRPVASLRSELVAR